jgi:CubicO group peptidase (beta-lactamase class C family)
VFSFFDFHKNDSYFHNIHQPHFEQPKRHIAPDVKRPFAATWVLSLQVFLDGGTANGLRFTSAEALNRFTACLACDQGNRRGLGFDKRQRSGGGPACLCTSTSSFGHTGFTGTFAWADPETGIVLVFLSNRVFPDASVNKLAQMGIRTDLQQVVYSALL